MELIKTNERLDDLQIDRGDGKSVYVIQNPEKFCFGIDAVLLANFAEVKKSDCVLDMCSGSGVVGILVSAKKQAKHVTLLEVQPDISDMSNRSILYNEMQDKISVVCDDLKTFKSDRFDVITCNPPYKKSGTGAYSPDNSIAVARHELLCTLEDVISSSARLLKQLGRLYIIHRPERLADCLSLMREYSLEPKRIRFIHPNVSGAPTMFLAEAVRCGKPNLTIMPPLYVYDEKGGYTDEINTIYGR